MVHCSAIYGEIFSHDDRGNHDECGTRLYEALKGVPKEVPIIAPCCASETDLLRVHTSSHIRMIREFSSHGGQHFIDQNTYIDGETFDIASYAAGASIEAVNRAIDGESCFAIIRPPGHHAERDRAMGFCIFNNAAIAATVALDRVDKVAIIDWDLHHGNGTQTIFSADDRVLFCSIHQGNIFPHTGWVDEIGTGKGKGFTINAPLRTGSTIADYRLVFEEVFIPALEEFKPDAVIVSAGQDPLFDDPKSGMLLFPADFGTLTAILRDATDQPLALVLEGGYGPSHGDAISQIFSSLHGSPAPSGSGEPHRTTSNIVAVLKKIRK
ncbi:MAG TPA: histone deacetylase [Methanoregula sp.]|nr:histone deacetylase [Methanoregula sp.]